MSSPATQQTVDDFLSTDAIPLGPEFDCPYLPERKAQFRCFLAGELEPEIYHALMDRRFRRSGNLLYQPNCPACDECRQLRVPVAGFKQTKSQRRVWHRNRDLRAEVIKPQLDEQKWRLYSRYLKHQHDGRRFCQCHVSGGNQRRLRGWCLLAIHTWAGRNRHGSHSTNL